MISIMMRAFVVCNKLKANHTTILTFHTRQEEFLKSNFVRETEEKLRRAFNLMFIT